MDYAELFGYLSDDLRRANALMNQGAREEALTLCNDVIQVVEAPDILDKNFRKISADAHETKYHALLALKRTEEADQELEVYTKILATLDKPYLH
ncbi:hypothetical protein HYT53_02105 [Candidatus Woesearchaeota archaeon]|nr:hypothetical protein [Candidatus Woesearchaeota archaeon]